MIKNLKVKDVYSKEYEAIDGNEPLSKAIEALKNQDGLFVFLDKKFFGILSRKDFVRLSTTPKTKIKALVSKTPKLSLHTKITKASRLMIENNLKILPVFDGEKVVGALYQKKILEKIVKEEFGKRKVKEFMTKDVVTASKEDSIGKVLNLMYENNISRVPIVDGDLEGIVTTHDIVEKVIKPIEAISHGDMVSEKISHLGTPIKVIMKYPVIKVLPNASLKEAIEKMIKHNINGLVIYDKRIEGILTGNDLLEVVSAEEVKGKKLFIQFSGFDSGKEWMVKEIQYSLRKFRDFFGFGSIYIYFKEQKKQLNENSLYHCRIRFYTDKDFFVTTGEGWGALHAFKIALDKLERMLYRSKGLGKKG